MTKDELESKYLQAYMECDWQTVWDTVAIMKNSGVLEDDDERGKRGFKQRMKNLGADVTRGEVDRVSSKSSGTRPKKPRTDTVSIESVVEQEYVRIDTIIPVKMRAHYGKRVEYSMQGVTKFPERVLRASLYPVKGRAASEKAYESIQKICMESYGKSLIKKDMDHIETGERVIYRLVPCNGEVFAIDTLGFAVIDCDKKVWLVLNNMAFIDKFLELRTTYSNMETAIRKAYLEGANLSFKIIGDVDKMYQKQANRFSGNKAVAFSELEKSQEEVK